MAVPGSRQIPGGLFISFEGPDCSGKSTQVDLLARHLRERGFSVLKTREPGGTEVGEQLRAVLKHGTGDEIVCSEAELLLFCACRAQLMHQVILPHLDRQGIVICDRFADSTTAYQGYGRHFDLAKLDHLHAIATTGRWPDITFLLDLSVDDMEERGQRRLETLMVQDRFEDESRHFREAVRRGYLELARRHPERIKVLDATAPREILIHRIIELLPNAVA